MNEAVQPQDKGIHLFGRPLGLVLIVAYKAIWGAMELAGGILLAFSQRLVTNELAEDPQDQLINWLISRFHVDFEAVASAGPVFAGLGLFKLVLAAGIWSRSWRFRSAALVFFSAVALFGAYSLLAGYGALKLFAELADLGIVFYLWKILPRHLHDASVNPKP